MQLSHQQIENFQESVWEYYKTARRNMPWREQPDPYWVLVSEIMLQQTQVDRVQPKFLAFVEHFPAIASLAAAPLSEVLRLWNGLGYNRRAKFLWLTAQEVAEHFAGNIPDTFEELVRLPGIGKNTAGAILAYAFNQPAIFIETNVRSVYLHHFFANQQAVSDRQILELLEQTLDREQPREWYWALMDYGTHLKQTVGNNIGRSRHYIKQSTFAGSRRQLRGRVLKLLLNGVSSANELAHQLGQDERLASVLVELEQEGFIKHTASHYLLT